MLSQGIPGGDVNLRGEIPQGFDLQQLISQLDPATLPANNPLRGLYLSQIPNIAAGSPSPNSQPPSSGGSSAAPEPSPTPAGNDMSGLPNWFQTLLPQQSQQQAQQTQNNLNVNQLFEQMAMNSLNFNLMGGNMNAIAAALGQGNGLMGHSNGQPQNKDAYCELCDKEFCNRYFLKTHRQKKHGIAMDQSPTKSTPTMPTSPQHGMSMQFGGSGGAFPFNLAPSTSTASQPSVIVNGSDEREIATPPLKKIKSEEDEEKAMKASIDNLILASMNGGSASCDECGQTFATIFAVMTHKAKEHSGNTNESSPAVYKCSECDKEFDSSIYLEKHQIIQHGGGAAQKILGLIPPNFPFVLPTGMQQHFSMPDFENGLAGMNTPKQNGVKRQYSSNGKNYCDLCNKEVCNKYFLRTHMLKMHGIVIDENKTVIANIDTVEKERMGTLSFRCDICMTELKSRNLLRSHKQEVHGVMPITASSRKSVNSNTMVPTSPSIEEKCPVCDRRMSLSALTVHIQTEHAGELNGMIPQLESRFQCKYCPSRFNDEMEYQMHNIQHTVVDLIKSQEQKATDPSVLQCSMCQYTTYDPHNLEMHIDRHERMNDAKSSEEPEDEALKMTTEAALKMVVANKFDIDRYKCHQCDIPYADAASLDAHNAVAHLSALNLTVPKEIKKDAADDKVVERNSHTSGSLSPSGDTLPEGFGKVPDSEKPYLLQTFVLRTSDSHGNFLDEIIAHLPVKSLLAEPTHVTFELVPSPMPSSYQ